MSIASQLTALEGNISNAYDMVAQRGGTVPARKNMENLDDAIATIPSGGGSTPTTPTLTNATLSNGVITLTGTDFGSSPKVLMFNRKYDRYDAITPTTSSSTSATVPVGASDYGIFSRVVKIENGGYESGVKFVYGDFEGKASSYQVAVWCYANNTNKTPLIVGGVADYTSLCGGSATVNSFFSTQYGRAFTLEDMSDSTSISTYSHAVRGIEFSPSLTDMSGTGSFLTNCGSLNQPLGFCNVTHLFYGTGSSMFLGGAYSFNSPIDTSSIVNIGSGFMRYCTSFNQPMDLSNVREIGGYFLGLCQNYNQPIVLRGDANTPVRIFNYFMWNCIAMSQPITFEYCNISNSTSFCQNMPNLPSINVLSSTMASYTATALACTSQLVPGAPSVQQGITVNGDSTADTWLSNLADSATRKLLRGTITP